MIAFHEGLLLIRPVGTFCHYNKKKNCKIQQQQQQQKKQIPIYSFYVFWENKLKTKTLKLRQR